MKKNVFLFCLFLAIAGSIQAVVRPQQSTTPSLAPMQKTEAQELVCASYEQDKDWNDNVDVTMFTADEDWKVYLLFTTTTLVDNQEYTISDLNTTESYIRYGSLWSGTVYNFSSISYKQWTDADGSFHVRVTATSTDAKEWNITYDKSAAQPIKDTVTLTFAQQEVSLEDNTDSWFSASFEFAGKNSEAEIHLTFYSDAIAGTYTMDDFEADDSSLTLYDAEGVATNLTFTDATATVVAIDGQPGAYTCDFIGVASDGRAYKTSLTYVPTAVEKDIVATNLVVENMIADWQKVTFKASDETYSVTITVNTDTLGGTWKFAAFDSGEIGLVDEPYGFPYSAKDGEITFTEDENEQSLTGWVYANNITFHLSLSYAKPENPSAIHATQVSAQPTKQIVNGQLLIEKNGELYTVTGVRF